MPAEPARNCFVSGQQNHNDKGGVTTAEGDDDNTHHGSDPDNIVTSSELHKKYL